MKRTLFSLLITLLLIAPLGAQESNTVEEEAFPEGFSFEETGEEDSGSFNMQEEKFSIYGYLVNFFNVNFYMIDRDYDSSDVGDTLYLRLKADFQPEEKLSFHMEIRYQAMFGNMNNYALFENYGLIPFSQAAFPTENFNHEFSIDHAWASVNLGKFDLQFGRIPIAWGTGYVFNPTARTAGLPFLDAVTEETPGTLGIVPSFSFIDRLAVQGYLAFEEKSHKNFANIRDGEWNNLPWGAKLTAIPGSFDLSVGWAKEVMADQAGGYMRRHFLTLDTAGGIWDIGLYGEAAVHMVYDEKEKEFAFEGHKFKDLIEVCLGADYEIPGIEVVTRLEYYHQGVGQKETADYDFSKTMSGEQLVMAEDYLFLMLEKTIFNYFQITIGGLLNLNDQSGAVFPMFSYDVYNNFQLSLGAYIFAGRDGSEFNGEYEIFPLYVVDFTHPSLFFRMKLSF